MVAKERLEVNLEAAEFQELQRFAKQRIVLMVWLGRRAIVWSLEQKNGICELLFPKSLKGRLER